MNIRKTCAAQFQVEEAIVLRKAWPSLVDACSPGNQRAERSDIASWRRSVRERLIRQRMEMTTEERDASSARIASALASRLGDVAGITVGVYWPVRGEPNLYPWIIDTVRAGATLALPVIVRSGWPLEFRAWQPGEPLDSAAWNIPVPRARKPVVPQVIVAPAVAFDRNGFRLGYGGGSYQNTIAAGNGRAYVVGVGFGHALLPTVRPGRHEVPLDMIVTDEPSSMPEDS